MKEIFYKVTLLSDVVLNSTLATEGNMTTLDYIPGSNFLGITASKLYNSITPEMAFSIFHSGKVRFGDATISINKQISYPIPAMLFMDKVYNELGKDTVYLDYLIDRNNPPSLNGNKLQLKQLRSGYLLNNGEVITEIPKSFAVKSAQDRKTRTAEDGKMFGFESLNKGLEFIFSVQTDDVTLIDTVHSVLEGIHRLGKSKNAEFGQVEIIKINAPETINSFDNKDFVLVYAQSNLCFTDSNGAPTFEPTAEQLGFSKGEIDWTKSQIRTHSYSPWNFKRNTTNTQRDCISKGSVLYIKNAVKKQNSYSVGLHQADGLGKIICNPSFLEGLDYDAIATLKFIQNQKESSERNILPASTNLTKFLSKKHKEHKSEKSLSEALQKLVYSNSNDINRLKKISSSQWGGIRAFATKSESFDSLKKVLFDTKEGYLNHGIAEEKYWGKNRGANRIAFEKIVNDNKQHGTQFIAKFAAEMAKESRKLNKTNN